MQSNAGQRVARWVPRLSALLILAVVLVVYTHALRVGHWPPSHPWSGVTLVILAVGQAFTPTAPETSPLRWARLAGGALGCGAALMWLVAAFASGV
jgi:hypothetical protein